MLKHKSFKVKVNQNKVCQFSQPPSHSAPNGNSKFEILLAEIFTLKQKPNKKYLQPLNQILCLQESSLIFLQTEPLVLCKR